MNATDKHKADLVFWFIAVALSYFILGVYLWTEKIG